MSDHGIEDYQLVREFQLGVVIDPLPGDERFEGWLSIPYLTRNGVKAIRFRRLSGEGDKYGQAKGQKVRIYNPEAGFSSGQVIGVAEGEIDAIVATKRLGLPTVGIPGAQMWLAHNAVWKPIFKNFQRVFILPDGDTAGKELAEAVSDTLGLKAQIVNMPADQDVSSMYVAGRADEITKQLTDDDEGDE